MRQTAFIGLALGCVAGRKKIARKVRIDSGLRSSSKRRPTSISKTKMYFGEECAKKNTQTESRKYI